MVFLQFKEVLLKELQLCTRLTQLHIMHSSRNLQLLVVLLQHLLALCSPVISLADPQIIVLLNRCRMLLRRFEHRTRMLFC